MDDAAGKVLARSTDLIAIARDFTRIARDEEAISARDAHEIDLLADAAHGEDFQGQKAGGRAVGGARNLLLVLAEAYSAALAGTTEFDVAARATLVQRAGAVLASAEASVEMLAGDMPDDLRHAFRALAQAANVVDQLGHKLITGWRRRPGVIQAPQRSHR